MNKNQKDISLGAVAIIAVIAVIFYEPRNTSTTEVFVNEHGVCDFAHEVKNNRLVETSCPDDWRDQKYRKTQTVSEEEQKKIENYLSSVGVN